MPACSGEEACLCYLPGNSVCLAFLACRRAPAECSAPLDPQGFFFCWKPSLAFPTALFCPSCPLLAPGCQGSARLCSYPPLVTACWVRQEAALLVGFNSDCFDSGMTCTRKGKNGSLSVPVTARKRGAQTQVYSVVLEVGKSKSGPTGLIPRFRIRAVFLPEIGGQSRPPFLS